MRLILAVATLALTSAMPCQAQVPTPTGDSVPTANSADVESIDAIIAALYDVISGPAGQARDWARFRSLFSNETKLIPIFSREGSTAGGALLTVEDYITRGGPGLEANGFFESEIGRVTEKFGNIAHAFSTYQSQRTADGEVFQRGINSIQLIWDNERWWIMNIMWWGVGPDEEIPGRYLGN